MADSTLKQMVLDAPSQVLGHDKSITSLNTQLSDLTAKLSSLQGVCNKISEDLETYLTTSKYPTGTYYFYKGFNFNQSTSINGNFTDWKLYKLVEISPLYVSSNSFLMLGDQRSIFHQDMDISIVNIVRSYSTISSALFEDNITTITINDSIITESLSSVWLLHTVYMSGDSIIDTKKIEWDFTHDYIIQPLGMNGTYGILDGIAKLTQAKNLVTSNKNKIEASISVFGKYSS